jgi:hypothetical protein
MGKRHHDHDHDHDLLLSLYLRPLTKNSNTVVQLVRSLSDSTPALTPQARSRSRYMHVITSARTHMSTSLNPLGATPANPVPVTHTRARARLRHSAWPTAAQEPAKQT